MKKYTRPGHWESTPRGDNVGKTTLPPKWWMLLVGWLDCTNQFWSAYRFPFLPPPTKKYHTISTEKGHQNLLIPWLYPIIWDTHCRIPASTRLKNISQIGSFPQVKVKQILMWNQHLDPNSTSWIKKKHPQPLNPPQHSTSPPLCFFFSVFSNLAQVKG